MRRAISLFWLLNVAPCLIAPVAAQSTTSTAPLAASISDLPTACESVCGTNFLQAIQSCLNAVQAGGDVTSGCSNLCAAIQGPDNCLDCMGNNGVDVSTIKDGLSVMCSGSLPTATYGTKTSSATLISASASTVAVSASSSYYAPSGDSSSQAGAIPRAAVNGGIVGGAIAGGVAFLILAGFLVFRHRRRRRRRLDDEFYVDDSQLVQPFTDQSPMAAAQWSTHATAPGDFSKGYGMYRGYPDGALASPQNIAPAATFKSPPGLTPTSSQSLNLTATLSSGSSSAPLVPSMDDNEKSRRASPDPRRPLPPPAPIHEEDAGRAPPPQPAPEPDHLPPMYNPAWKDEDNVGDE